MDKTSFFSRENVKMTTLNIHGGIPLGIEIMKNQAIGVNGAYCAWGESYNNQQLPALVSDRMHGNFPAEDVMNLDELGFLSRHHIPRLSEEENKQVEYLVGTHLIEAALEANGWNAQEVDAVLIGTSGPVSADFLLTICQNAGIRADAIKVDVHKACDGSMGALQLVLNESLGDTGKHNLAKELFGKKVLVGGIEGLSRFTCESMDKNALQLFANGAGIFGLIPGKSMKFLAGRSTEIFDEEGLLQVRMYYPHSRKAGATGSLVEVTEQDGNHLRLAGMMHEPSEDKPILMAGLMGMVKLFVRNGVVAVTEVFNEYTDLMKKTGHPERKIDLGIVHHANFKINQLKAKHLAKEGIHYPMPWTLNDFGNVSAASCAIAFLRQLQNIKPGDHILFDGFGAGSYYDVIVAEMAPQLA